MFLLALPLSVPVLRLHLLLQAPLVQRELVTMLRTLLPLRILALLHRLNLLLWHLVLDWLVLLLSLSCFKSDGRSTSIYDMCPFPRKLSSLLLEEEKQEDEGLRRNHEYGNGPAVPRWPISERKKHGLRSSRWTILLFSFSAMLGGKRDDCSCFRDCF